ncbi:MAG: hypothetical protein WC837_11065 [Bellilinea sp.]
MDLFRVHAFTVDPSRTSEEDIPPQGGAVAITPDLQDSFALIYTAAKFDNQAVVDFDVDVNPAIRTNDVRDAIMQYAFAGDEPANRAATGIALRLAAVMDFRSKPNLFVLTALREQDKRFVILWMFPRDVAFKLTTNNGGANLEVLKDIFSQTSLFRKAAKFEGRNLRTDFLSGHIIDFQSSSDSLSIAEFWMVRFLQCKFALAGEAGSRLLADALRDAIDVAETMAEKEQLFAAIVSLRNSPRSRWSLAEIADAHLQGTIREAFLSAIPNRTSMVSTFDLNREVLDTTLKFRIFSLDTGVFVSSPFSEVGRSVSLEGDDERRLECRGTVMDQKVRTRHG